RDGAVLSDDAERGAWRLDALAPLVERGLERSGDRRGLADLPRTCTQQNCRKNAIHGVNLSPIHRKAVEAWRNLFESHHSTSPRLHGGVFLHVLHSLHVLTYR